MRCNYLFDEHEGVGVLQVHEQNSFFFFFFYYYHGWLQSQMVCICLSLYMLWEQCLFERMGEEFRLHLCFQVCHS